MLEFVEFVKFIGFVGLYPLTGFPSYSGKTCPWTVSLGYCYSDLRVRLLNIWEPTLPRTAGSTLGSEWKKLWAFSFELLQLQLTL